MHTLRQFGISGRFKAIKIGVIVDFLDITPSIRNFISDLTADDIEYTILDAQRIYYIEDSYFDIIILDSSVGQVIECIDKWGFLISSGGLLVEMISDESVFRSIPAQLHFQETLNFSRSNSDLKNKCLVYKNNDF